MTRKQAEEILKNNPCPVCGKAILHISIAGNFISRQKFSRKKSGWIESECWDIYCDCCGQDNGEQSKTLYKAVERWTDRVSRLEAK